MQQSILILGAGHGSRMGGPKIFTGHGSQGFLQRILSRCRETALPVVLVIDPDFRKKTVEMLEPLECSLSPLQLVEAAGRLPMLASVQAGLRSGACREGFWCWPVDAPFLSAVGWVQAVDMVQGMPEVIWKLSCGGKSGHPVWFPDWTVPLILAGSWDDGLQGLLREQQKHIHILELQGEELRDFNTPEQLASASSPAFSQPASMARTAKKSVKKSETLPPRDGEELV